MKKKLILGDKMWDQTQSEESEDAENPCASVWSNIYAGIVGNRIERNDLETRRRNSAHLPEISRLPESSPLPDVPASTNSFQWAKILSVFLHSNGFAVRNWRTNLQNWWRTLIQLLFSLWRYRLMTSRDRKGRHSINTARKVNVVAI